MRGFVKSCMVGIVAGALLFSLVFSGIDTKGVRNDATGDTLSDAFMNETWNRTFGGSNIDVGYFVEQTSDGGYIIVGYTRSFGHMSGHNIWLIKTDALGNEEWNRVFGGDADDEGYHVQQTSDGGYIITGCTKSFGAGFNDVILIKTDSSGNEEWNRTFGGGEDEEGYAVRQTSDGGYLIAGCTSSFGAGSRDIWLIKTDASGNEEWNKTLGGLSSDGARFMQQTTDGGYILAGWTFSYGPGYLGNIWLVKTDSMGNEEWNRVFGGSDADRGYSVCQTTDGGYLVTGYTASFGAGLDDVILIKTDASGNEEWNRTYGGTGRDYGYSVQQVNDGGYVMTGYTLSYGAGSEDVWVIKTDASGNEVTNATYGGIYSDEGYSIQQTSDGGYAVVGFTLSYGAGVHDVWLIKLSENISEITVDIDLLTGWNLITVPVENNYNASDLAALTGGCEMIAWWDASTGTYTTFIVGVTPPGSPWDFAINDGIGYYVKVANDTVLTVSGMPLTTVNVTLYTGWNTIGWWKMTATTASSLSGNITNCTMLAMYDAASGSYTVFLVGITPPGSPYDFTVERGMGLFAKVTSGSVWHGEG